MTSKLLATDGTRMLTVKKQCALWVLALSV